MGTKTITITEEAYNIIRDMKRKKESFSDLFKRIAKEKNIDKCFGIMKGENISEMKKRIKEHRIQVTKDAKKREDEFSRHFSSS